MRDVLGRPDPADAALAFAGIGEQLPESAKPLRDILSSREVRSETETFDILDDVAQKSRDTHERLIKGGLRAVLASAFFAGLAIVIAIGFKSSGDDAMAMDIRRILTFLQFASLFLGVFLFGMDARNGGNSSWKRSRAQAEASRLKQFLAVLETKPEGDPAPEILPLKLAFIRRYLWQAQLYYIEGKLAQGDERQASQKAGINWIRLGILLAAGLGVLLGVAELLSATNWFGSGLAQALDGAWVEVFEAVAGAIAVLALGIIAHRQGTEGFHRDNDAKQRLLATQKVLSALGGRWDKPEGAYLAAEAGAQAGEMAPVHDWLEAIISVQESEHHEWLEEMERAVPASTDAWAIWRILQPE